MVRTNEAQQYLLDSGLARFVTCSPIGGSFMCKGVIMTWWHHLRKGILEMEVNEFLIHIYEL